MIKLSSKQLDILVLILLMPLTGAYAFLTKDLLIGRSVFASLTYFIPAIAYLGIRKKKNWEKIIISTLVFGALFGFFLEFINEYTKAYTVVSLITPIKIFGVLPPANLIGHMMMTMLTVSFYEHFIEREINHHISQNLKYAVLPGIIAIATVIAIFFYNPGLLNIKLPYFQMGMAAVTPIIYLSIKRPGLIKKFSQTAIFFFFLYLFFEIIAVKLGWWIYTGNNYIGWVTIFNITFPFEEFFFWMMFYAASITSYYEIFIDDEC